MKNLMRFLYILSISCLLWGCGSKETVSNNSSDLVITSGEDLAIAMTPSYAIDQWSCFDGGILFCGDSLLKLYDFSTENSYVLCGDVNCKHRGEDCPAWISTEIYMFGASIYEGKLYYFVDDSVSINLYSQNITGDQKQLIWKKDHSSISEKAFSLTSILSIMYHKGYVWGEFCYDALADQEGSSQYSTITVTGINLENGSEINLNELPDLSDIREGKSCFYSQIAYLGEGEIITYTIYPSKGQESTGHEIYVLHDLISEESRTIHESDMIPLFNEGINVGSVHEMEFFGKMGTKYVCTLSDEENTSVRGNNKILYLYDPEKDSFEVKAEGLYGFPFFEKRYHVDSLIDNSVILTAVLQEDKESVDVFCYDLVEETSETAFQDTRSLKYRLFDQTKDYFIIKVYSEGLLENSFKSYLISKDDYMHGNFDACKEISVK